MERIMHHEHLSIWLTTGSALGITLANINPILTCLSLVLAISYTAYKFWKEFRNK